MMDRREALLLVERLKRRTRDPDVLTLCEYVHGTDVHGTVPGSGGRVMPVDTAGCVSVRLMPGVRGTSGGRDGEEKDGAMGAETDADVRVRRAATLPRYGSWERYCVRAGCGIFFFFFFL